MSPTAATRCSQKRRRSAPLHRPEARSPVPRRWPPRVTDVLRIGRKRQWCHVRCLAPQPLFARFSSRARRALASLTLGCARNSASSKGPNARIAATPRALPARHQPRFRFPQHHRCRSPGGVPGRRWDHAAVRRLPRGRRSIRRATAHVSSRWRPGHSRLKGLDSNGVCARLELLPRNHEVLSLDGYRARHRAGGDRKGPE
jgi:hypothetical protein